MTNENKIIMGWDSDGLFLEATSSCSILTQYLNLKEVEDAIVYLNNVKIFMQNNPEYFKEKVYEE